MSIMILAISNDNYEPYVPVVEILPTTAAHIRELQRTIREADRKEIENYGFSCAKGLWMSFKRGLGNNTALVDGRVAAIWGCAGCYLGSTGQPWLLTSPEVEKVSPLYFARLYQREIYKMLNLFPTLTNYVAADYEKAIRLLQIIGFEIGEPEILGFGGIYRKFTKKAKISGEI